MVPNVSGDVQAQTLTGLLEARASATPQGLAFVEHGDDTARTGTSWAKFASLVDRVAKSLSDHRVWPGTRVGILAQNSVQWETCQMAALANAATVVGLDIHHTDATLKRLIECTRVSHLFVGDSVIARRVAGLGLEPRPALWLMAGDAPAADFPKRFILPDDPPQPLPPENVEDIRRKPTPDDMAIVVFSSGTTGHPKPIGYTHRQVLLAVRSITSAFPSVDSSGALVCWLPLANLFQRIIDFCAIARGNPTHIVADPRSVMRVVPDARPQLLLGVPRFFERAMTAMQQRVAAMPWPVGDIASRTLSRSLAPPSAARPSIPPSLPSRFSQWASRRIVARLNRAFGGEVRYLVSGSAPLASHVHGFFDAIGLPVLEAYGVSECIIPIALNTPDHRRVGSVGRAVSENEVGLSPDGEVLVRGPGVFAGYLDDEPGVQRLDEAGYWHTGDRGRFDEDGFLVLEGRLSDAFKLSTGRWINPLEIESTLRTRPGVDYAAVVGAGRKTIVCMLNVSDAAAQSALGLPGSVGDSIAPAWLRDIAVTLPEYQRPAGYLVLRSAFTVSGGELTVNLKLRRNAIAAKYAEEIETFYRDLDRYMAEGTKQGLRPGPWVRTL